MFKNATFQFSTAGGSLPNFFAAAAQDLNVEWGRVKFVFCDERMVPENDPESTFGVYKDKVIGKVPIPSILLSGNCRPPA
jgi:6-phosphogluconolactonase